MTIGEQRRGTGPLSLLVLCALAAGGLPGGCATAHRNDDLPGPPPGSVQVQVTVVDKGGDPLPGEVDLFGQVDRDRCVLEGKSCSMMLPPGDYSLVFRRAPKKVRGRAAPDPDAEVQRAAGCLRARVTVQPGLPTVAIVCKRRAAFSCSESATDTLDCGGARAASARAGGGGAP